MNTNQLIQLNKPWATLLTLLLFSYPVTAQTQEKSPNPSLLTAENKQILSPTALEDLKPAFIDLEIKPQPLIEENIAESIESQEHDGNRDSPPNTQVDIQLAIDEYLNSSKNNLNSEYVNSCVNNLNQLNAENNCLNNNFSYVHNFAGKTKIAELFSDVIGNNLGACPAFETVAEISQFMSTELNNQQKQILLQSFYHSR